MAVIYTTYVTPRARLPQSGWVTKNLPSASGIIVAQNLSDGQSVSDMLSKNLNVFKIDGQTLADGVAKTILGYISGDGERMSDSIVAIRIKNLVDAQSQSDGFSKALFTRPSDGQAITDAVTKTLNKFLGDAEQFSDFLTASVLKSLGLSDAQSQADSLNKILATRLLDEQVVADSVTKAINKFLSGDGESLTDFLNASILKSLGLSDAQSQADGISKMLGGYITEGVASTDALSKTLNKAIVGDGIAQADSVLYTRLVVLAVTDFILAQDSITKTFLKMLPEEVATSDTLSKILKAVILDGDGILGDGVTATVITPPIVQVATVFVEFALTAIADAMARTQGTKDPIKRVNETIDAAKRIVRDRKSGRK